MSGPTSEDNSVLSKIEDVKIDGSGRFKYILVNVSVKGNNNLSKQIIRGTTSAGFYHADILDQLELDVHDLGVNCNCPGGGWIKHEPQDKKISVFGYSQGFGRADHSIAVRMLKEKYSDYTSISETNDSVYGY